MPAPVFLRFAMLREWLDISIEEAAADLGIASGWLHELEDFMRVAAPEFQVRPRRGFAATTLAARLAEVVGAYTASRPDYPPLAPPPEAQHIAAMLRADAYFHSLIPYFANVFIDFRPGGGGYQEFFRTFVRRLLCLGRLDPAVVYAPQDPYTARALDYALRRFWGATRKKRRGGAAAGVWYEPTGTVEPGQPLGVLHGGPDAWRKAFWAPPGRKPHFAYLLLYILLKRLAVSMEGYPEEILSPLDWPVGDDLEEEPDPSFPAGAALVLDTAVGDVTAFFRTILEPCDQFYVVRGNMLSF